jgi:hypothetical protein
MEANLLTDRKDRFGLERFSDEHWIASHPSVKPCDCDAKGSLSFWSYKHRTIDELEFNVAPMRSELAPYFHDKHMKGYKSILGNETFRIRE